MCAFALLLGSLFSPISAFSPLALDRIRPARTEATQVKLLGVGVDTAAAYTRSREFMIGIRTHQVAPLCKRVRQPPVAAFAASSFAPAAGVFILAAVVIVHELGHFCVARLQGVLVDEFSIGWGPRLLRRPGTGRRPSYALRILPLGGFVSFPRYVNETRLAERGLKDFRVADEQRVDPLDPDLLENRPRIQQAAVVVAGVAANLVFAWSCLFTSAVSVGIPEVTLAQPISIVRVVPGSAAATAGLQAGDLLLEINGRRPEAAMDPLADAVSSIRRAYGSNSLLVARLSRGSDSYTVEIPRSDSGSSMRSGSTLGVELKAKVRDITRRRLPPLAAAASALDEMREIMFTICRTLLDFATSTLRGSPPSSDASVTGPIGIVQRGGEIASRDTTMLYSYAALLSLNLAVVNSLPLPGLDGFQLLLLLGEAAAGSKVRATHVLDACTVVI